MTCDKSDSIEDLISKKWQEDCKKLPLDKDNFEVYSNIHRLFYDKLKSFPDLINCKSFNDKVSWLKLFDQDERMIELADKIKVKSYIQQKIGDGFTPKIYQTADNFGGINWSSLPNAFALKANNDSGTVVCVQDKTQINAKRLSEEFNIALSRGYGWTNGEWMYSYIRPKIFAEELIKMNDDPPPDYKFHCVNGQIVWIQLITGRGKENASEVNVDEDKKVLDFLFNPELIRSTSFAAPTNWAAMKKIASELSNGWKYIRVDLYSVKSKIYVGELTFYPLAGCIDSKYQEKIGKLLNFSLIDYKSCIIGELEKTTSRHSLYKSFR